MGKEERWVMPTPAGRGVTLYPGASFSVISHIR